MSGLTVVVGWFVCAYCAYHIHKSWWRNVTSYTRGDRAGGITFSLIGGPLALIVAVALWLIDAISLPNSDEVIAPQKDRRFNSQRIP